MIRSQRWHAYGLETDASLHAAVVDAVHNFGIPYERLVISGSTTDVSFRCHLRNFYRSRSDECPDSSYVTLENECFEVVTKELKFDSHVQFVYPHRLLCATSQCSVIEKNVALYKDQHHLTTAGADVIVKAIVEALSSP